MMYAAAAAAGAGGGILSSSASVGQGVRVISGAGTDFSTVESAMDSHLALGALSDCRSSYHLLSGRTLADSYRRIYTTAIGDKEQGLNQGRYVDLKLIFGWHFLLFHLHAL